MGKPIVGRRDRLALWCLRMLTRDGVVGKNVPLSIGFGPGNSTVDDPKLVMYVETLGRRQTIVALVFDPPDDAVTMMTDAVRNLRAWADEAVNHG